MIRILVVFAVFLLASVPRPAAGWENVLSHPALTRAATGLANTEGELDRYFDEVLGEGGVPDKGLPLIRGLDGEIDRDIEGLFADVLPDDRTRLSCTLNLVLDGICLTGRPEVVVSMSDASCAAEPGGQDTCERFSVERLLQVGAYAEDNPNPRARHHFLDPTQASRSRGLDNSSPWLLGLDVALAEAGTLFRGGDVLRAFGGILTAPLSPFNLNFGNFDLTGRSADDRALDRGGASAESPANLFSLVDAERYLYRSLTAPTRIKREHYLGLHVLAVGHVAHLLEDMGVPAHVRNDFIADHLIYQLVNLEAEASRVPAVDFIKSLSGSTRTELLQSRPAAFVSGANVPLPLSYLDTIPGVADEELDPADLWTTTTGDAESPGLAELVSANFISAGTTSRTPPGAQRCPRQEEGPLPSALVDGLAVARLPYRGRFGSDAPSQSGDVGVFLSSPMVPHLAHCRYHSLRLPGTTVATPAATWSLSVVEESVQRDYLEILIPLTIDYTAKFMQNYLKPRIELVPLGDGEFRLRNLTRLPFDANLNAVQVVFDTVGGGRRSLPVVCGGGTLQVPANTGPNFDAVSTASCQLPSIATDSDPNAAPKDRGEFWVIVRGQLGSRGESPASSAMSEDWKVGDYVTAFARSTNEVVYQGQPPPFGAPGLLPEDWDALERTDFYRSRVELTGTLDPNSAATPAENLTAHLRLSPLDDFRTPAISPTSGRIALMTDVGVDPFDQNYLTTTIPELPGVLIPANPLGLHAFAGIIEPSEDSAETTLRVVGSEESDLGPLPVWLVGEESFFAMRSTGTVAIDLALYDAESGQEQPHPIPGNFPVTGNAASLIVAEGENPAFGCALSGQEMLAAKNDQSRGRLFAARVSCVQTTVGEGGSESYGRSIFGRQVVLFDAAGQPIEALMVDANNPLAFEARPCPGGCDFDGFVAPVVEHASFSPSLSKLAVVVRNAGAQRIFVYDYQTRQVTRIAASQECVHAWVTWAPGDEHIAYFANGSAPCAEGAAQLYVTKADGSEPTGRAVTNFKDGWRRANPSWWSPLRLPAGPP